MLVGVGVGKAGYDLDLGGNVAPYEFKFEKAPFVPVPMYVKSELNSNSRKVALSCIDS